jgi:hypothetical protein
LARSPLNTLLSRKVSKQSKQREKKNNLRCHSVLNTLTLVLAILYSCSILLVKTARYFKRNNTAGYEAINKPQLPRFYGATSSSNTVEEDVDDDQSSSATVVSPQINNHPWSVYNWLRVLMAGIQVGLVIYTVWSLVPSSIDEQVEGQYRDLIRMYYSRAVFWVKKKSSEQLKSCILIVVF